MCLYPILSGQRAYKFTTGLHFSPALSFCPSAAMDPYSPFLERLRVPQPSLQRLAVLSLFDKLRSSSSSAAGDSAVAAISHCLHSPSPAVVDESVRQLCRLVSLRQFNPSHALLELQAALEGSPDPRFLPLFVKAIGFLCRLSFQADPALRFDSPRSHPFVKVVATQALAQTELLHQVLVFIVQNTTLGVSRALEFLNPFLAFCFLSPSLSLFARELVSSMAALSCSSPCDALPIVKVLIQCLKCFHLNNIEEFKYFICSSEYLVDAVLVIMKQLLSAGLQIDELQLCSAELLDTLLLPCADLCRSYAGSEHLIELSKRLLHAQKELGLEYVPDFSSVVTALFIILVRAEFEHEQLSALKLSLFLLKWKNENDVIGITASSFGEELLFVFPVINLLASPSTCIKVVAIDFLSLLERLLQYFSTVPSELASKAVGFSTRSKPKPAVVEIVLRLVEHLWSKGHSCPSNLYFLKFASVDKSEGKFIFGETKSWMSELRDYSLKFSVRHDSGSVSQSLENLLTGIPLLLSSMATSFVLHPILGGSAVDSLAFIAVMDPKVHVPLLLSILFYNKVLFSDKSCFHDLSLKLLGILPSLASNSVMLPLIIQIIVPMLQKDARRVLYATAVRLLCKTWEVNDHVFGNLQGILQPAAFSEFASERNICISMAASVRDVCKGNPDRGVDLILSVSACIESRDPVVQALGLESLGYLCEADVVDFYTAWDVIANHLLDYSTYPVIAHGMCVLLRWGSVDAKAYPEASKSVLQILWEIGNLRYDCGMKWMNARTSAFVSLSHYEVEDVRESISDFSRRIVNVLISEDNLEVLKAIESLVVKIITYEHITRRRLTKEKRSTASKVEKLLDAFPQAILSSGKHSIARGLPGAALLTVAFNPTDMRGLGVPNELAKLHGAYESALVEIAESLQLSRNILVALLSLQSWKPFLQRWIRSVVSLVDVSMAANEPDKVVKVSDDILRSICRIADDSTPRCAENIALAIGALCMVLPPAAHAVTSTASGFLLKWLSEHAHEHRQWTAAISLGLVTGSLHATDSRQKFQIITGLLEVASNSKSTMVKGACGLGLGYASQGILGRGKVGDDSNLTEGTDGFREATLVGNIVEILSLMIIQFCPSSFHSLRGLCENFSLCTGDVRFEVVDLSDGNSRKMEEDVWGVSALVLGLANLVLAIYRAGAPGAVLQIKDMLLSWIPHVNKFVRDSNTGNPETLLAVGSCLALPFVVGFCQRSELMGDELDDLIDGYNSLISELIEVKKSGILHQSLLMASCIGAGNLLSCILNEGVHLVKADTVNGLLELMRNTYCQSFPPLVHFGGMLGVVNALGASAGILADVYPQRSSLQTDCTRKESRYIRGPLLSSPVFEPLCTTLIQEMFIVAQDSKDPQIQRHAAWAISFLRYRWWSKDFHSLDVPKSNPVEVNSGSQNFAEDSTVWKLCSWLMDLNFLEMDTAAHVNTVGYVLRCLSHAPRIPAMDWEAITRRCMKYEDQILSKLNIDETFQKGLLREECVRFSLAHANQVNYLLLFLDELSDLPRFRMLELSLQSYLLSHLGDFLRIFSRSRLEKLYSDMVDYFCSSFSPYFAYNQDEKSVLRLSFWKGLSWSLKEVFTKYPECIAHLEKCMVALFFLLPMFPNADDQELTQSNVETEWYEAVQCLGKARKDWLINFLQLPEMTLVGSSHSVESMKRISAVARLVLIGCLPATELGKAKHYILNTESDGIWSVLIQVVAALQRSEGSIKRQWLLDAVELSCITKYPSTPLQFLGLLCGSCCKYMPLLMVGQDSVLSDLPTTLPSLLSERSWEGIAESLVLNFWASTERIYTWATQLANGNDSLDAEPIDKSENYRSLLLTRVMINTCVSLKSYLPFDKQLRVINLVIP